MKKMLSWKSCTLGLMAVLGVLGTPAPAVAGMDSGLIVCMVSVLSGQNAAREALAMLRPAPAPQPTLPDRLPAPDLTLSSLPPATR